MSNDSSNLVTRHRGIPSSGILFPTARGPFKQPVQEEPNEKGDVGSLRYGGFS